MIILFGEYSYALIAFLISRCCLKQNLIDIAIKEKWIKNLIHKISLILLSCRLTGGIPSYIFQSVKLMSSKLDSFQIIFSVFFLSLPNTLHIQYLNCRFPKIKKCWISYGEFPDPPPTRLTYVIFYLLWLSFFFLLFLIGTLRWEKITNDIIFEGMNMCAWVFYVSQCVGIKSFYYKQTQNLKEKVQQVVLLNPERKYKFAPHKIYYVLRPHHVS